MKLSKKKKIFIKNITLTGLGAFLLIGAVMVIWLATLSVPDLKSFEARKVPLSTKIYDRTGTILLYDLHQDIKRTEIPFADMGSYIKNATVAIEDSEFYQHKGIRISSIIRAVFANLSTGSFSQGGSTITQQIVKNTLLTQDKTITRKLKEWVLALKIERVLSKEEILSIYLNESPYGGSVYGIEEAAQTYFGKPAKDLTLAEAAYLAAMPQAPSYYSPFGSHKDKLEDRKNLVLARMKELGFITSEEYASAKSEAVVFRPQDTKGIKAAHFVFFIRDYLASKYGEDRILEGGLRVTTTLDYTMQEKAEELVTKYGDTNAAKYKANNAGLVSVDPKTGQILAMVGSRDYFNADIDGAYNVTTAQRQPGSSFKPFVYATGFKMGYTPETILFDVPTEFNIGCNPYGHTNGNVLESSCYMPRNFLGDFQGPLTIRSALARSINVPAVKMLYLVGIDNAIKTAEDMGIRSLGNAKDYGLTLVLGGGEVRLLDMTSAYGVFATGGIRHQNTGVLKVEDAGGNILEEYQDESGSEVLPKNVALEINDILSDNSARAATFGANSNMYIAGRQVAVKTGTTNNFKDAWIIGYTPSLVTGIWVGNNDNTPMAEKSSVTLSGPLWNEYMRSVLASYPKETFEKPAQDPDYATLKPVLRGIWLGGESYIVDSVSGALATNLTPLETQKEIIVPSVHDILYWVDRKDPRGPKPANPGNDPEFNNWETAVQNWWASHQGEYSIPNISKPENFDTIHTDTGKPLITLSSPTDTTVYGYHDQISVSATMAGLYAPQKMDVFINNSYIGTTGSYPFTYSFSPINIPSIEPNSTITLKIVGTDSVYNTSEVVRLIEIGS